MLDVNLGPVSRSVRACMRDLVGTQRDGHVASVHAHIGFDGHAGYDATKGAMCALTRELTVEFGPRVRVNAVCLAPSSPASGTTSTRPAAQPPRR